LPISSHVGATAVLRISAANSNSNATANHLPRRSRNSSFASSGTLRRKKKSLNAFSVASIAANPITKAALASTPTAKKSVNCLIKSSINVFSLVIIEKCVPKIGNAQSLNKLFIMSRRIASFSFSFAFSHVRVNRFHDAVAVKANPQSNQR
jgi:hypothetical protein